MELTENELLSVFCKVYSSKLIVLKNSNTLFKPEKEIAIGNIFEVPLLLYPVLTIIYKNLEKTLAGFYRTIPILIAEYSILLKIIKRV